jgi:hypothetical protein
MKKVYKLLDKSLVLGIEVESSETTVTVKAPLSITQMMNPHTGEPEIAMLPMDLIFGEVQADKNVVPLKREHIMYEKPMADFPAYEQNYVAQTTGIETVGKQSVIS